MMRCKVAFVVIIITSLLCVSCKDPNSPYEKSITISVKGTANDADSGLLLEGVLLKIETALGGAKTGGIYQMLASGKSASDGSFTLTCQWNCERVIYLTAELFGYIDWWDTIKCQKGTQTFNVQLKPLE
jgi:hypothetical protein